LLAAHLLESLPKLCLAYFPFDYPESPVPPCSLYVEEVDVGEEQPRTVVSGLVKFIPEAGKSLHCVFIASLQELAL